MPNVTTLRPHTLNLAGRVRRETWDGREYVVAPLALIVPGVLNGSQGPLYYPPEEVGANPDAWDGMPIVVNHPTDDGGNPVSARRPDVLERSQIGTVFNTRFDSKLRAEGWFDAEKARRVSPAVLADLEAGRPIEVSTGLFTRNRPVENGKHNGKKYVAVAEHYRPDHLAILPDKTGACSVSDGCGVHVTNADKGVVAAVRRLLTKAGLLGNAKKPSAKLGISPSKACLMLKEGQANGHPLTEAQRGMFGALCGKRKKPTANAAEAPAELPAYGSPGWECAVCGGDHEVTIERRYADAPYRKTSGPSSWLPWSSTARARRRRRSSKRCPTTT
jgi:hypothetical protein